MLCYFTYLSSAVTGWVVLLKFTSVRWQAHASHFQSFQPRHVGTDPSWCKFFSQFSMSWSLWGLLKVTQSARKETQSIRNCQGLPSLSETPWKSNSYHLWKHTEVSGSSSDGLLCHVSTDRRNRSSLALRLCSRSLLTDLSGCLLTWALFQHGSVPLFSVAVSYPIYSAQN